MFVGLCALLMVGPISIVCSLCREVCSVQCCKECAVVIGPISIVVSLWLCVGCNDAMLGWHDVGCLYDGVHC